MASRDALISSHDDALMSSDTEVGQCGNINSALALSDDAPKYDAIVSSDLHVHQGCNDDGALASSDVQVYQGGNDDGGLASYDDVLLP